MSETTSAPAPRPRHSVMDWLDSRVNPVLVRDLRLFMRGRMLLVGYFVALGCLILAGISSAAITDGSGQDGPDLITIPLNLLAIITGALIPYLVGERFREEMSSHAMELVLASPLTASRLIRGKLYGAWCLSFMVLSVAMPLFVTAYLLGGVNPYHLFIVFMSLIVSSAIMPIVPLYLGTYGGRAGAGRIIGALVLVGSVVLMTSFASFLMDDILESRDSYSEWIVLAAMAVIGVLVGQFLYFVCVSRLRGPGARDEIAPRISLLAAAVLGWLSGSAAFLWLEDGWGRTNSWWDAHYAALGIVSWAFAWGVFILSRNNARSMPPPAGRSWFWRIGPGPLAMYSSLVSGILAAIFWAPFPLGSGRSLMIRIISFSLIPLLALGYGFLVYFLFLLWRRQARPGPDTLARTILLTNILLGIVVFFLYTGLMLTSGTSGLLEVCLAATPVGQAAFANDEACVAGLIGLVVLALLNLFLGWHAVRRHSDAA